MVCICFVCWNSCKKQASHWTKTNVNLGHKACTIGADPVRIKTINDMPKQRNVSDVCRFLGMCKHLAKCSPKITEQLGELLEGSSSWIWASDQDTAFRNLKTELGSPEVLAQYGTSKETLVSADCSVYGMGGVSRQKHGKVWRPVAFTSRSLSETEQRYAQTEKDCLALTLVREKFRN